MPPRPRASAEQQNLHGLQPSRRQRPVLGPPHPPVAVALQKLVEGAGPCGHQSGAEDRVEKQGPVGAHGPPASKAPTATVNSTRTATRGLVSMR